MTVRINMSHENLRNADLHEITFVESKLYKCIWPQDLTGVKFIRCHFEELGEPTPQNHPEAIFENCSWVEDDP